MGYTIVRVAPDAFKLNVNVETLEANTNKEIAIPAGTVGVHIGYGTLATTNLIYFKLDGAASIPNGSAYVGCGFINESENTRVLFEFPVPATAHTLNLMSAGAGTIIVEFWG
jgi:hypothetical protein